MKTNNIKTLKRRPKPRAKLSLDDQNRYNLFIINKIQESAVSLGSKAEQLYEKEADIS
jgi:hypothetical protein